MNNLLNHLAVGDPFCQTDLESLEKKGFHRPNIAYKNLLSIRQRSRSSQNFLRRLIGQFAKSFDPHRGLNNFERLCREYPEQADLPKLFTTQPEVLKRICALFAGSQYLSEILINQPSYVETIADLPQLNSSREALWTDLRGRIEEAGAEGEELSLLRRWKHKEYLHIGLWDLLYRSKLEDILLALSTVADVALQGALQIAWKRMVKRYGEPYYTDADDRELPAEFAVIGLGKLGGQELNFSSDIDIILIYTSNNGTTRPTAGSTIRRSGPDFPP